MLQYPSTGAIERASWKLKVDTDALRVELVTLEIQVDVAMMRGRATQSRTAIRKGGNAFEATLDEQDSVFLPLWSIWAISRCRTTLASSSRMLDFLFKPIILRWRWMRGLKSKKKNVHDKKS